MNEQNKSYLQTKNGGQTKNNVEVVDLTIPKLVDVIDLTEAASEESEPDSDSSMEEERMCTCRGCLPLGTSASPVQDPGFEFDDTPDLEEWSVPPSPSIFVFRLNLPSQEPSDENSLF